MYLCQRIKEQKDYGRDEHKKIASRHTILQSINGNDEVGQLIKEKFLNRLDTTSLKQIK